MAIPGSGGGGKGARSGGGKGGGAAKSGGGGASATSTASGGNAQVDAAFNKSRGANDNFVTLENFRASLGGTREQQDATIRTQRLAGRYSLDSHEGMQGPATPGMRAASITEGGSRLVYISRRSS
jgi:hypothetical protein